MRGESRLEPSPASDAEGGARSEPKANEVKLA
jgi:hypothetical protein